MGCIHSLKYKTKSLEKIETISPQFTIASVPHADLTEKETRIVKCTWTYMTEDLSENGLQIFLKIFELCPETKKLFHVENVRHSQLAKNKDIRAHGERFINAIGAAVDCLDERGDKKDELREIISLLGRRHKNFEGFKPEYFETFYEALMWRWEICMGENFTTEVSDTWSHVFVYMMEKLKEGFLSE